MRIMAFAVVLGVSACSVASSDVKSPAPGMTLSPSSNALLQIPPDFDRLTVDQIDSVRAAALPALRALEDTLRRDATSAATPRRLLALGTLMTEKFNWLARGTKDTVLILGRDSSYWYNEVGGDFIYSGYHFRLVEERFPADTLAAYAAWALSRLPKGGECEGYYPCYIARTTEAVERVLRKYPRSSVASAAVRQVDSAFAQTLSDLDSAGIQSWQVDTTDIRKTIAQYDTVATALPDSLRRLAYETMAKWVEKWGSPVRAAEMRRWLAGRRP